MSDTRFVTVNEAEMMVQRAVSESLLKICRAPRPFKLFGLDGSEEYAAKVAGHLGINLTPRKEKLFDDGEGYVRADDGRAGNVRGHNVFVVQSLFADRKESVADKFMKLCILCGSLRDASAHEITIVVPHLAWARQDRKTQSREPITTKYVAQMLESVGVNRALFIDVHNLAAIQNAFRIPVDNLEAKLLHAEWAANYLISQKISGKICVLTPDSGGLNRCERFRFALLSKLRAKGMEIDDIPILVYDKIRVAGKVTGSRIIGDPVGAHIFVYDDMISTFGTMAKACDAALKSNGKVSAILATHGLFCGSAEDRIQDLRELTNAPIVIADTIDPWRLSQESKTHLQYVDTTKMVADAIWRIHSGTGSISELLTV